MSRWAAKALFCFALFGCSSVQPAIESPEIPYHTLHYYPFYDITEKLASDSLISAHLDSYRDGYNDVMGIPVALVVETLRLGQPESSFGNLLSDVIRFRAAREMKTYVHIGLINNDSIKLNLNRGPLTLGDLYEMMPYDNHLVILTLTGDQVVKLANRIAELGGEPVSGIRMRIVNSRAMGLLVNSETVRPDGQYFVATSNYLAGGGGGLFPVLTEAKERNEMSDLLIREIYREYFNNLRELNPQMDQRIRL
jgi:2',3'-cyclic-nucleotide 2'-phosphodiesterase (5'-nucleotidase family)